MYILIIALSLIWSSLATDYNPLPEPISLKFIAWSQNIHRLNERFTNIQNSFVNQISQLYELQSDILKKEAIITNEVQEIIGEQNLAWQLHLTGIPLLMPQLPDEQNQEYNTRIAHFRQEQREVHNQQIECIMNYKHILLEQLYQLNDELLETIKYCHLWNNYLMSIIGSCIYALVSNSKN